MAETTKAPTPEATTTTANTATTTREATEPRYSKRLKGTQRAERKLTKAHRSMSEAVLTGIDAWDRNRDKSAWKKRDGAVKDAVENFTKAYAKSLHRASSVPRTLIKGVLELYPKSVRKYYGF